MISVPVSTVDKPLTVIDFIAGLANGNSLNELAAYANALPPHIVEDERFARAFKRRLDELKGKRAAA